MYEIEKGVPIPELTRRGKSGSKYPFAKMEVGDSFFIDTESSEITFKGFRPTVYRYAKILNCKFTIRKVDGRFRVWRKA